MRPRRPGWIAFALVPRTRGWGITIMSESLMVNRHADPGFGGRENQGVASKGKGHVHPDRNE